MEAEHHGLGFARPKPLFNYMRPQSPRGPVLGDLLQEIAVPVEEKGQPGGELVDILSPVQHFLRIGDAISQRERNLLYGSRTRLPDVVPADGNWVPTRHIARAVHDDIANQPH